MVGHTGDFKAAVKACEAVDYGLGKLITAIKKKNGCLVLTADHGNCELMVDPKTKKTHTAHTTNLVPFAIFGSRETIRLRENGKLADVAPTILDLMGLKPPEEMTGKSMIEEVYCE
jgi:2,3-bisphosphoglycerate-independent phosphoglycerate mutase